MVPTLVYVDDCRFCTWSARFAVRRGDVQPVLLSRVPDRESRLDDDDERGRLPDGYERCAQLITEDAVYSCSAAMEQALVIAGMLPGSLVDFLRQFEDYELLRETACHLVSSNRDDVAPVLGRYPPVSQHVVEADVLPEGSSR